MGDGVPSLPGLRNISGHSVNVGLCCLCLVDLFHRMIQYVINIQYAGVAGNGQAA
ncbi:MAG TPA: hypothetical protein VJ960_06460 [Oceanipulchritudo sp.]|nr:hypothetical protein [Oceanipulchritudo sp.]